MNCIGEQCGYCIPHLSNESCFYCTLQCNTFKKNKINDVKCRIIDEIDNLSYELRLLINMESKISKINKNK